MAWFVICLHEWETSVQYAYQALRDYSENQWCLESWNLYSVENMKKKLIV